MHRYYRRFDASLECLLLLAHLTAGQPARGTEMMGIQHTTSTFHRNMFIEDSVTLRET